MIYYYDGVERLQWLFDSPNKLAAFVCMLFPFVVCLACRCHLRNWWWRMSFVLLSASCITLECVLAQTYSRGGFIAFGVALAVLAWCGLRKSSALLGGSFCVLLLIVPKVAERVVQINPATDLSVWHRLLLWKGACGIAANAFPFGIQRDVGSAFGAWYQALDKHQTYLTSVSDPLTIAARYGLPFLFVLLFIMLTILFSTASLARRRHLAFPAALAASGVSFLTAGLFSTFYTTIVLAVCFVVIVVISLSVLLQSGKNLFLSSMLKAFAVTTLVCLSIGAIGTWVFKINLIRFDYGLLDGMDCCRVRVAAGECQGLIVYLFDKTELSLEEEGRQSVRPTMKRGWPVILIGIEPDEDGLRQTRKALGEVEMMHPKVPVRLIGQNAGGRFALILASESNRVDRAVSIGAFSSWPIRTMSPADSMRSKEHLRVKVVNGENDWRTNPQESSDIRGVCESLGIDCEVVLVSGVGNRLDEKRQAVLSDAMTWLCE